MKIGKRINERRKELKISAEELGKRLNKDRSTIYRYENGDIENLPLDILEPIAKALETTPAYLMGWENPENIENMKIELLGKEGAAEVNELATILKRINKDEGFRNLLININKLNPDELENITVFVNALVQKKGL